MMTTKIDRDHFRGCLLGGALGDALGYPLEFNTQEDIKSHYGRQGIRDLELGPQGKALISVDTQMMLFTGEGILNAWKNSMNPAHAIWESYLRWYSTQGYGLDSRLEYGELLKHQELHARRAPGITSLSALATGKMGSRNTVLNHSKGNGSVMRVAPAGLVHARDSRKAFRLGQESAMITHGHPTSALAAGFLAALLSNLLTGSDLRESVERSMAILQEYSHHEETRAAVEKALRLANFAVTPREAIRLLGPGNAAEEALAMGLYASLKHPQDFREGVILAVNHGGDSDSTGIVAGYILGAALGIQAIPFDWLLKLELSTVISAMADELLVIAQG